ncbi:jg26241 [Pararge aegeria aegeria]|uniref:Jg26241 protein n=1 Tax=Pararge aegeria aegeria TaxID=348720 RepID=A0A8S4QI77_9NEOP|nr:jg26241 [Pararge aegeria aegeria]
MSTNPHVALWTTVFTLFMLRENPCGIVSHYWAHMLLSHKRRGPCQEGVEELKIIILDPPRCSNAGWWALTTIVSNNSPEALGLTPQVSSETPIPNKFWPDLGFEPRIS